MKAYVTTALGNFCIEEQDKKIIRVSYVQDEIPVEQDKLNYILKKAQQQLQEYCLGERQEFKLPLNPQGTAFQKKVWQALSEIPYGETATYKEIAERKNISIKTVEAYMHKSLIILSVSLKDFLPYVLLFLFFNKN